MQVDFRDVAQAELVPLFFVLTQILYKFLFVEGLRVCFVRELIRQHSRAHRWRVKWGKMRFIDCHEKALK